MPKTKSVEAARKTPEECILKMGKNSNVIQWREEMYNLATEEFYTNIAFSFPFPHEREYNPFYVEPIVEDPILDGDEDDGEDEEDEDIEEDIGEPVPVVVPAPALPDVTRIALVKKLREGAYEARRKRVEVSP